MRKSRTECRYTEILIGSGEVYNIAMNALDIVNQAIELGFDKCGIIPAEMMVGYKKRLEERMEHFPQTKEKYEAFRSFSHLQKEYSWAKAVVIVSFWYGKYWIPNGIQDRVAKYYLTDKSE